MTSISRKFKPGQEVVILNLMVNGSRYDALGTVQRYIFYGQKKELRVEVLYNECYLYIDESKLLTYDEWRSTNGTQTST